jgi:NADH-quinone oxidoreductase subunit L
MYRLVYLTFYGKFRGTPGKSSEQEHHLHESPPSMTVPLWILAILSIFGGLLSLPHAIWHGWSLHSFLHPIMPRLEAVPEIELHFSTELMIAAISTVVAIVGWLAARSLYKDKALASDAAFEQRSPALARALENKWYVDELYAAVIVRPLEGLSRFFWKGIDAVIDGLAAALGYIVRGFGEIMRFFQTGNVRNYALMFFIGVLVFVAFFV